MRGRGFDYSFIDSMIVNILRESEVPMQPLGVSFKVNEKSGKIINLNVIKRHLEGLVEEKKISKIFNKETETVHYMLSKR